MDDSVLQPKKNHLVLCELHFVSIHGKDETSDPFIDNHYIVYGKFNPHTGLRLYNSDSDYDSDYDSDSDNECNTIKYGLRFLRKCYEELTMHGPNMFDEHPTIRNYYNIISKLYYIKPEIAQCILLPTNEMIAIVKTFWLRIIQRTWKKIYKERIKLMKQLMNPSKIYTREIGKHVISLPGIKGMLKRLKVSASIS